MFRVRDGVKVGGAAVPMLQTPVRGAQPGYLRFRKVDGSNRPESPEPGTACVPGYSSSRGTEMMSAHFQDTRKSWSIRTNVGRERGGRAVVAGPAYECHRSVGRPECIAPASGSGDFRRWNLRLINQELVPRRNEAVGMAEMRLGKTKKPPGWPQLNYEIRKMKLTRKKSEIESET